MAQQANQGRLAILGTIHDLQEQMMRVNRFSNEELEKLRGLFESLAPSGQHSRLPRDAPEREQSSIHGPTQPAALIREQLLPPAPEWPESPPPVPGPHPPPPPPPPPSIRAHGGSRNECSRFGETGPESVEAALGLGPGLASRNISQARDIIPPPPSAPLPSSPPPGGSSASTSEGFATVAFPSAISPSGGGSTLGQSKLNLPTGSASARSDWPRDGNLVINQRACCPHCSRPVFIQVSSTVQAGDITSGSGFSVLTSSSSSTEAVLRFRVHVLTVSEMISAMRSASTSASGSTSSSGPSSAAHGFMASTPTNPNTSFTFPP